MMIRSDAEIEADRVMTEIYDYENHTRDSHSPWVSGEALLKHLYQLHQLRDRLIHKAVVNMYHEAIYFTAPGTKGIAPRKLVSFMGDVRMLQQMQTYGELENDD